MWIVQILPSAEITTGNAKQSLDFGATWADLAGGGTLTQQGLPFIIEGEISGPVDVLPWLSENPLSGTVLPGKCQEVLVSFNSTGLTPGIYTGALDINSNDLGEPTVTVPVTLEVIEPPEPNIVVDPLSLETTLGVGDTGVMTFTISNVGDVNLDWTLGGGASWMSQDPTSGTVLPGEDIDVTVTFDAADLDPAVYTATVNVESNDPDEPVVPVEVTLTVIGEPDIIVTPQLLEMTLHPNQIGTLTFTIENQGTTNLTWTLSGDSPEWMSEDPSSGTVLPGETTVVTVTFDATGLTQGIYTGFLDVESNDPDETPRVNVTLIVLNYNFYIPIITNN